MDVLMPQLGETVDEGTVTVWHKKAGDRVEANDILLEIETDKVATEVPATHAGVLTEILVGEGETVAVGTRLAVFKTDGPEPKAEPPTDIAAPVAEAPAAAEPKKERPARAAKVEAGARLSPVVRRLLKSHGLEASDITGTGQGGRITRQDVQAHVEDEGAAAVDDGADDGDGEFVAFDRIRKATAAHMVRSKATSPHVLQAVEVDFGALEEVRAGAKSAWKKAEGFSLTYLPFVARAVCLAMPDYPRINATSRDDGVVLHKAVNLAFAVDLGGAGLIAPVIRDAGGLSLADLARAISDVAGRARNGKLKPDDLAEGTYSITNNGSFGTLLTAPIINQPQVAILSLDGVARKPVVVGSGKAEEIVVRPVGVLAQSFDHRAIDGAYSAAFLRSLKEIIETRDWAAELA